MLQIEEQFTALSVNHSFWQDHKLFSPIKSKIVCWLITHKARLLLYTSQRCTFQNHAQEDKIFEMQANGKEH